MTVQVQFSTLRVPTWVLGVKVIGAETTTALQLRRDPGESCLHAPPLRESDLESRSATPTCHLDEKLIRWAMNPPAMTDSPPARVTRAANMDREFSYKPRRI